MEQYNSSKEILIVDDCIVNRKVLSVPLKKYGFNITEASDGIEALNSLVHKKFDVILMDICMPNMDGIEATLKIREKEWIQKLYEYLQILRKKFCIKSMNESIFGKTSKDRRSYKNNKF